MKSVVCSNEVTKAQNKRVLVTLINPTKEVIKLKKPNLAQLVHEEFKEALIFGLLGVLRLCGEDNVLASVTGATADHSSGKIFNPAI